MDMISNSAETVEILDVESASAIPFLPGDDRWAIRFNANGTVTLVLGVRDYGGGWYSGYFAGLAGVRLGIPLRRIRIYYSAQHPAALRTPTPSAVLARRGDIGPFAGAVADIIEALCSQVIEKGRLAFAATAGIGSDDVGFDALGTRYFVVDKHRSRSLMELAVSSQPEARRVLAAVSVGHCNE